MSVSSDDWDKRFAMTEGLRAGIALLQNASASFPAQLVMATQLTAESDAAEALHALNGAADRPHMPGKLNAQLQLLRSSPQLSARRNVSLRNLTVLARAGSPSLRAVAVSASEDNIDLDGLRISAGSDETPMTAGVQVVKPIETTAQFLEWYGQVESRLAEGQDEEARVFAEQLRERVAQCAQMMECIKDVEALLGEMESNYLTVCQQTEGVKAACAELQVGRDRLESVADEISGQLAVYNSLGPITQLVHAPGDRVCLDREFLPSLERAETAIQYIEAHPEGKDSELYLMRFSQCRMRALTLIKIHALRVFRTLASDAASSVAALAPSSRAAELYVQFRASAVSLGPLLRALQQRAEPSESTAGSTEGQVLLDVQHAYFQTRRTWLQPYIQESLKAISREHKEAASAEVHVGLLQDWCAFMMNVCVDEYRLYHDFFETSGDQSSGAPAPPELRAYLDSAMTIFHEQVRPLIIHESDVAVLAGLSMTLLTYHRAPASEAAHMSTELDGSLQNSRTSAESDAGLEEDNEEDGLDAFYASVDQVLQDAQHRLAFRAQAYIRSHIGGYKISKSDADAMSRWVQLCLRLHVTDPSQLVDLVAQASVTVELQGYAELPEPQPSLSRASSSFAEVGESSARPMTSPSGRAENLEGGYPESQTRMAQDIARLTASIRELMPLRPNLLDLLVLAGDVLGLAGEFLQNERDLALSEQLKLLSTKYTAELEDTGNSICGVRVMDQWFTGRGRILVTLGANSLDHFSRVTLNTGDIVLLDAASNDHMLHDIDIDSTGVVFGVLSAFTDSVLDVRLCKGAAIPWQWNNYCSVFKLVIDVRNSRILAALSRLCNHYVARPTLHGVVFLEDSPTFKCSPRLDELLFINESLDEFQKYAVHLALTANDIALIHGPLGTGKTHTIVEIVRQLVREGKRILVCGPSNISVDNMAERLSMAEPDLPMVRIGNPTRVLPAVMKYSLHYLVRALADGNEPSSADEEASDDEPSSDIESDNNDGDSSGSNAFEEFDAANLTVSQLLAQLTGMSVESEPATKKLPVSYYKLLRESDVINAKSVVLTTLCTAGGKYFHKDCCGEFDVVIIDEATQAIEGECWIAALKAPKLILAGDHHQLQPVVKCPSRLQDNDANSQDNMSLQLTLFERMHTKHGDSISRTLYKQYRMNTDIMRVSSDELYHGMLTADESVATHVLCDLEHVIENAYTRVPLVIIDTSGHGLVESQERVDDTDGSGSFSGGSGSKANLGEAKLANRHIDILIAAGVDPRELAIISPYNAQVRLLSSLVHGLHPKVEIGSVDGFQGREKEAIVLSLVRSNEDQEVGFLDSYRRMNVAITRARRHLCVIADSSTASQGGHFMRALFKHLMANALFCSPAGPDYC
ncbi:hypothetical protein H4R26_001145 [Coemansia thaxteri]|uniref:AAA+ ATPase domain-containing protein n=1 Tax=Coemansia thaxteri TaxID=2663907 RepID=A0A9W8EH69_9FUNG|nr:hypothetical protein H4R26_001145 [Coemansia thaxteri]